MTNSSYAPPPITNLFAVVTLSLSDCCWTWRSANRHEVVPGRTRPRHTKDDVSTLAQCLNKHGAQHANKGTWREGQQFATCLVFAIRSTLWLCQYFWIKWARRTWQNKKDCCCCWKIVFTDVQINLLDFMRLLFAVLLCQVKLASVHICFVLPTPCVDRWRENMHTLAYWTMLSRH